MDKRAFEKLDLDKDFEASIARVEELRKGRTLGDIPVNDEYWTAVQKHKAAHNKKGDSHGN